jgi:hypothetical protein
MKNSILLGFGLTVLAFGCKKSTDETPQPTGFTWPAGTGAYAPYTIGSTFVFETGPTPIDSVTYTVTKDTTIAGVVYKKLQSNKESLRPSHYANYTNGVVTDVIYNYTLQGFTVPTLNQTVLKDNLPVNATWQESFNLSVPVNFPGFPPTVTVEVRLTDTIKQRDFSHSVLGKPYLNSIFVRQNIGIDPALAALANLPANLPINNYFAPDFGLIERVSAPNAAGAVTDRLKRANIIK